MKTNSPNHIKTKSKAKTIYLCRHAETEENIRMNHLRKAGHSIKSLKPPNPTDVFLGCQFLGMVLIGRTNSIVSANGTNQIQEMQKIVLQHQLTPKIKKVAHSPLIRAKETCYGVFDLDHHMNIPIIPLDCLREVTPFEFVFAGRTQVKRRIQELYKWIKEQEEDTIAIVGHSEYFLIMLGLEEKFKNCDVWKATFCDGKWTNLELQHRLNGDGSNVIDVPY